jgi:dUTP pyrophosphatase
MKIDVKKLRENAIIPEYQTRHSAGMDLCAAIDKPITIKSGERCIIPVGFALAVPSGFEAQVRPRSGLAAKNGITTLNSPGTIDADYRGEIGVILVNHGQEDFVINPGDRIAQMIIAKYERAELQEVDELDKTARGVGGFGSTGK